MIENLHKDKFGLKGTCKFNLFNCEIDVAIYEMYSDEKISLEYVEKCIQALNSLPDSVIDDLCKYSIRYFESVTDELNEEEFSDWCGDMPKYINGREILKYIYPNTLIFHEQPKDKNSIALSLELNCQWEEEHGMEWDIRDNQILNVSDYRGVGALEDIDYYKDYCGNYVFNE